MAALTSKQRIGGAFKKTFTDKKIDLDRVPAYMITGQCNAQLVGATIKEFLLDPKVFVKAQVASYERYKPDILVMQGDLQMDAEAMGNELKFIDDSMCICTRVALEDKGKLSSLKLVDPHTDGRMPNYLEALSEVKKIITDAAVSAVLPGPWMLAAGLRDADRVLRDAMKDPEFLHELMAFTTQMSIRFGEAVSALKVGVAYSEAPASCSLISPKIYREFVFPYQKQVVDHFKEKKVGVGIHICGYVTPILEDIVKTGVTNLSIDAPTDLAKAVEATRKKTVLIGNVDTNLFYTGSRQQMEQAIKDCLAVAPDDSGFILSTGCEVPGVAPLDKIDWFMDIVNEVGAYS